MIIRQKKVRQSEKFTLRYVQSARNKKELAISNYTTAIVQFALSAALLILSYQSYFIFTRKIKDLSVFSKYTIPFLFFLGGIVTLKSSISRFLKIRSEQGEIARFYEEERKRKESEDR
jgi:hypothetical protein